MTHLKLEALYPLMALNLVEARSKVTEKAEIQEVVLAAPLAALQVMDQGQAMIHSGIWLMAVAAP